VYKVRLRLTRDGGVEAESQPIPARTPPARLRISPIAVDAADRFLFHKTTHRKAQDQALAAVAADCDDVVLLNGDGKVTETTRANLVLELGGSLVTPPLESGLLPGVKRAQLLEEGRIRTAVIHAADLRRADRIHLVNSVRGWYEGLLIDD
jgi:para-aminobenzoate synthetase / 4-amino-4-deoxychorismate lyase